MNVPRFGNLQANDPFFTQEDHATFTSSKVTSSRYDKERQQIRDKFLALHDVLYSKMKREGLSLHPHWHPPNIVSTWYIGRIEQIWFMKLRYLRSRADVQAVEEMMGVPKLSADYSETQYTKHPMIDIRIDSDYLAIELLVTDKAWLDAQNFKKKVEQHKAERQHLIHLLQDLGHDYIFGGWPDTSKPEITTAADLANEERLLDWVAKFDPGYNWLRLGIWYTDHEDFRLTTGRIVEEVLYRFKKLYPVYQFLLWTPDNNFR